MLGTVDTWLLWVRVSSLYVLISAFLAQLHLYDLFAASLPKMHYASFPVVSPQQNPQQVGVGKSPLCLLCRIVSQIPLQRHNKFFANMLRTCCGLVL